MREFAGMFGTANTLAKHRLIDDKLTYEIDEAINAVKIYTNGNRSRPT